MPNPTQKRVHENIALANISVAYQQDMNNMVSTNVFPQVNVNHKSNNYWVYDAEAFNRDEMLPRAPGTESAGIGFTLSQDSYNCKNYALHENIADEEMDNADEQFDLMADATELLTHKAMLNKEVAWHNAYFKTGVWAADVDVAASADFGSVVISDPTSTFIEGMKKEIESQKLRSHGFRPNTLVIASDVWRVLSDQPQFLDRVIGGANVNSPADVQPQLLAQILGIDNIMISDAIINTAAEGQAASNSFIASNGALLCYVTDRPGRKRPTAGYQFTWTRSSKGNVSGTTVRNFYMEHLQATRVEVEHNYDFKVVSPEMGTFFSNLI